MIRQQLHLGFQVREFKTLGRILLAVMCFCVTSCASLHNKYPNVASIKITPSLTVREDVIELRGKRFKADYGWLVTTQSTSDVGLPKVRLPVLHIYSHKPNDNPPIFILNGGPGASNLQGYIPKYLLNKHNVVIVGYRGADGSPILRCNEVSTTLDTDESLTSKAFIEKLGSAWSQCANRLTKEKLSLENFTVMNVIQDLENVREKLGYSQINLLSSSYGTRLAYLYGVNFPKQVAASIMIGATPPGTFQWTPDEIDSQLNQYAELWASSSNNKNPSLSLTKMLKSVTTDMPNRWLWFDINEDKAKLATFVSLYHRNGAAQVFDAYQKANLGDPSGLAVLSNAYDFVFPNSVIWGDFASKIMPLEYESSTNYYDEFHGRNSILGSPIAHLFWSSLQSSNWPKFSLPEKFRTATKSEVPTLVISGNVDFSTPANNATEKLMPHLSNGQQVILSDFGHTKDIYHTAPAVTEKLILDFYYTRQVDIENLTQIPIDFEDHWSWSTMAKAGLAGLSTLILLLL